MKRFGSRDCSICSALKEWVPNFPTTLRPKVTEDVARKTARPSPPSYDRFHDMIAIGEILRETESPHT